MSRPGRRHRRRRWRERRPRHLSSRSRPGSLDGCRWLRRGHPDEGVAERSGGRCRFLRRLRRRPCPAVSRSLLSRRRLDLCALYPIGVGGGQGLIAPCRRGRRPERSERGGSPTYPGSGSNDSALYAGLWRLRPRGGCSMSVAGRTSNRRAAVASRLAAAPHPELRRPQATQGGPPRRLLVATSSGGLVPAAVLPSPRPALPTAVSVWTWVDGALAGAIDGPMSFLDAVGT